MGKSNPSFSLTKWDAVSALLIGGSAAALYARTLAPGLLPGDSAEFQVLIHFQATAHTTGYSIYLLLAKLLSWLGSGEAAYRANLFSAGMGGVTIACVYLAAALAARSRLGALLGAAALALSATFWSQAVIAEVYTSAAAFLSAALALSLAWYRSRDRSPRRLFWAGVCGGLGLGVHGSVALAAPAVLLLIWPARAELRRVFPAAVGGAALGLLVVAAAFNFQASNRAAYNIFETAYVPAASAWDESAASLDSNLERFRFIQTAQQWRPAMFADPLNVMPRNAAQYGEALLRDYAWPVLALIPLGLAGLFCAERRLGWFLLCGYGCHMLYTLNYGIGDVYVFFVPAGVYTALAAAAGSAALQRWLGLAFSRLGVSRGVWAGRAAALLLLAAAVWPFAGQRAAMLRQGEALFSFSGMPDARTAAAWRKSIAATVRALPPNAIAYLGWGDLYAYYYVAAVEQGRADLRFIELMPYSRKGGMADSMLAYIRAHAGSNPQYFQYMDASLTRVGAPIRPVQVGGNTFYQLQP